MDITSWIAIIGCLTGVSSLCLETARYLSEKPHIQIGTFNELCNMIYINDDVVKCYLNLRIMNTGDKCILLQDVYMRRPGATRSILKNLVHYNKASSSMPWSTCNGAPIKNKPASIHLPASIPAGGVFEANFLFVDFMQEHYISKDHFVYPTLCIGFSPNKVKEYKIQAILTYSDKDEDYWYVDREGNKWQV